MSWCLETREEELIRPLSRCGHVSFCDGNKLYVWGGYRIENNHMAHRTMNSEEVWVYHNNFNHWKVEVCTGGVPPGPTGCSVVVVGRYAYLLGGHQYQGHVDTVYRLDLINFCWLRLDCDEKTMSARDKFAAWAYDDKIYIFGGYGPEPKSSVNWLDENGVYETDEGQDHNNPWNTVGWNNQLIIYQPAGNIWTNPECFGPVPSPRAAHGCARLKNKVYTFAGRHQTERMKDLHCLDLDTLTWSGELQTYGQQPVGRSWHTFNAIDDNRILLFAGFTQDDRVLDDAFIFTASTSTWTLMFRNTMQPRLWHTAVTLDSKEILSFGGCTTNISQNSQTPHYSDKVLKFQFEAPPLLLLCLEKAALYGRWEDIQCLPLDLQQWVQEKRSVMYHWSSVVSPRTRRAAGPHFVKPRECSPAVQAPFSFARGSGDPGL